jgi:hypothetical protein
MEPCGYFKVSALGKSGFHPGGMEFGSGEDPKVFRSVLTEVVCCSGRRTALVV